MFPYKCRRCDLVYLHPPFSEKDEARFYRSSYRALYHGKHYDLDQFHELGKREAKRRAEQLDRAGLLRGTVLEVGSATGYFLEEVAPRKDVRGIAGVELDDAQRRYARGRGLTCVRELDDLRQERFDLIVLFHVLEHVSNPVQFLLGLATRLETGGALAVEVPNVDDALLSVYEIEPFQRFYWHPAHRVYFSKNTLLDTAHRAGFAAKVEPLQRYSIGNHLHWATRGEPGGEGWLDDLIGRETREAYAKDLCRNFVCDTLWMTAQRRDV